LPEDFLAGLNNGLAIVTHSEHGERLFYGAVQRECA